MEAVTMVDAALVRYHPVTYDRMLASEPDTDRRLLEQTLAALRFVRNQIADQSAVADLVEPTNRDTSTGRDVNADPAGIAVTNWVWRPSAPPAAGRARSLTWEIARYEAYQARLAGHRVGDVFDRVEPFLRRTADVAARLAGAGAVPAPLTTDSATPSAR